jgi:hypothetical protein
LYSLLKIEKEIQPEIRNFKPYTVENRILLAKLEHYEVRGEVLGLLGSYLGGRFQYVVYNGGKSGRWEVRCRVPQGSVLGPLFFLIYVNDMVRASGEFGFVLFADDTNLFAEGGTLWSYSGR